MANTVRGRSSAPIPPLSGGLGLLLFAAVFAYCPTYLHINGWQAFIFYAAAVIALAMSSALTFQEIARTTKNETFDHLGSSITFVLLTSLLYVVSQAQMVPPVANLVLEVATVLMALVACIFVSMFLASLPQVLLKQTSGANGSDEQPAKPRDRVQQVNSFVTLFIGILSALSGLIGLVQLILRFPPPG